MSKMEWEFVMQFKKLRFGPKHSLNKSHIPSLLWCCGTCLHLSRPTLCVQSALAPLLLQKRKKEEKKRSCY